MRVKVGVGGGMDSEGESEELGGMDNEGESGDLGKVWIMRVKVGAWGMYG